MPGQSYAAEITSNAAMLAYCAANNIAPGIWDVVDGDWIESNLQPVLIRDRTISQIYAPAGTLVRLADSFGNVTSYEFQSVGGTVTAAISNSFASYMKSTVSELISAYEAEMARVDQMGYRNEARTGYPIASDIPTISASATDPASDADAATQVIYPFDADYSSNATPINQTARKIKKWIRGFNSNLASRSNYDYAYCLYETITTARSSPSVDRDSSVEPGAIWDMGHGVTTVDFILDGDVFFIKHDGYSFQGDFELFVNGSIVTSNPGTNVVLNPNGRMYNLGTGVHTYYVKFKFSTSSRRRIMLRFPGNTTCSTLYTRATSTMLPAIRSPKVWLHSGDSFSQYTISDINTNLNFPTLGLVNWMHSMFGFNYDFINLAVGGTSLAGVAQILPSTQQPYTAGLKCSNRKALLASKGLNASIFTALLGHNDALTYQSPLFVSEFTSFISDVKTLHPNALIIIFSTSASPGLIAGGYDIGVENAIKTLCQSLGVTFVPIQTVAPAFLRGTGKQGSTTGVGNSDNYTGPDGTHPSGKGHREWGLMMAQRMYETLRMIPLNA